MIGPVRLIGLHVACGQQVLVSLYTHINMWNAQAVQEVAASTDLLKDVVLLFSFSP